MPDIKNNTAGCCECEKQSPAPCHKSLIRKKTVTVTLMLISVFVALSIIASMLAFTVTDPVYKLEKAVEKTATIRSGRVKAERDGKPEEYAFCLDLPHNKFTVTRTCFIDKTPFCDLVVYSDGDGIYLCEKANKSDSDWSVTDLSDKYKNIVYDSFSDDAKADFIDTETEEKLLNTFFTDINSSEINSCSNKLERLFTKKSFQDDVLGMTAEKTDSGVLYSCSVDLYRLLCEVLSCGEALFNNPDEYRMLSEEIEGNRHLLSEYDTSFSYIIDTDGYITHFEMKGLVLDLTEINSASVSLDDSVIRSVGNIE